LDEKLIPLPQSLDPDEPRIARRRRVRQGKGVAIVALLFIWWAYYSIPILLGFEKDGDTALREDETKDHDFDTVRDSPSHIKRFA
jgi:hypothetical protein